LTSKSLVWYWKLIVHIYPRRLPWLNHRPHFSYRFGVFSFWISIWNLQNALVASIGKLSKIWNPTNLRQM
jgi:hypothetical protein